MTRLAPACRENGSIHHINTLAWIEPTSRTTSRPRSGGSRRRPALPLGRESPPLPAEDHFLVALDRGLSVFDKPARLARSACGSLPPSSRAVRVAVRVHRREVSRTRCGRCGFTASRTSSRWSQPEALSGLPSLLRSDKFCIAGATCRVPTRCYREKEGGLPDGGFSEHPNAFRA